MAKTNYVDNKLFLKEISAYRKAVRKAKREKAPKPRIPEYVGQCFMLIAENMSHKYNFLTYSWRDEMVSDAIENCVMYADNFNPAKSKNPFAYFSQIVYYAFLRRIQREKKQLYVKYKSTELHGILDDFNQMESEDGMTRQFEQYDNISEFIQKFEDAKAAKKAKAVAKGLEKFIE
jgi:DNA-directed RNA polymerase specialized sigma24 family protein